MKKQVNKINFIYILSFLGDALFCPFLALYFSSLGITDFEKGVLLALIPLSTLCGSLIYGKLSNTSKRNILIIRILVFAQLIAMSCIGFIDNYYIVGLFVIIFALHNNTFFSFQDGIAVNITNKENTIYAKTRVFGTFGYFLGSLLGGFLIDLTSFGVVFLIAGLIYALVEVIFFFVKPYEEEGNVQREKISFKNVLSNKQFIGYLLFYILVLGTWTISEAYVSLMFELNGFNSSSWGYLFAYQIIVEMVAIFLANKFIVKKINIAFILLSAIVVICLRSFTLGLTMNVYFKGIIQASLRGLGWGLFLSSHMEMVKKILPKELITKAILILAISVNLYATLGNYLAPYIYNLLSYELMYLILMGIQIIGVIIYMTIFIFKKNKVNN